MANESPEHQHTLADFGEHVYLNAHAVSAVTRCGMPNPEGVTTMHVTIPAPVYGTSELWDANGHLTERGREYVAGKMSEPFDGFQCNVRQPRPKVPKGGLFPAPVYVATLADGTQARMSFWCDDGENLDFARGRRLIEACFRQPVKFGYVEYDGQKFGDFGASKTASAVSGERAKAKHRGRAVRKTMVDERDVALRLAMRVIHKLLECGATLPAAEKKVLAHVLELVA